MANEAISQNPDKNHALTFDKLVDEWYALQEGQEKLYIVADREGKPVKEKAEGRARFSILNIRAEAKHKIQDGDAVRTGIRYTAYEYSTSDLTDIEGPEAYYDTEYADRSTMSKTYIPLDDFIRDAAKRARRATDSPKAQTEPTSAEETPSQTQDQDLPRTSQSSMEMSDKERRAEEIKASAAEYLRAIGELLDTTAFRRIQRDEFAKTQILNALQNMKPEESEHKARPGVTISRLKQSYRGENVMGKPLNPMKTAKTLVIRVWLETENMAKDQMVSGFEGRKERVASIRAELEKIKKNSPTDLLPLLQKEGYEQVRLEVGSWRARSGESYELHIPIMGIDVPKPESKQTQE